MIQPFLKRAHSNPTGIFISWNDEEITYEATRRIVAMLAERLADIGVAKGDRVGLLCENSPSFIFSWFAVLQLGAVLVPLNTNLHSEQHRYMLENSRVKLLLHTRERHLSWTGRSILLEKLLDGSGNPPSPVDSSEIVSSYASDNDPALIIYTSGTTGVPKGVLLSHRCYSAAAEKLADVIELRQDDRILICLPLFHANPQVYAVLTAIRRGASLAILPRFSASTFWDDVARCRATGFTYVGSVLAILAKNKSRSVSKSQLRFCVGGGAPLYAWDWLQDRLGIRVHELYGMTETGGWVTCNGVRESRRGSCGPVRDDMDVAIVDEEDRSVATGSVGEIVVRPREPSVLFDGYDGLEHPTPSSPFRNLWFHTGDLGRFDDDQFLYFVGRKKHIIRRGGENISPKEIEDVLLQHPAVTDAAVVGVPDDILEEEIKAVIVPGPDFAIDELISFLREHLPGFMIPAYVELVQGIPRTATEKVKVEALQTLGEGVLTLGDRGES